MRNKRGEFVKGQIPWNKNKKGLQIAWNKGKKNLIVLKRNKENNPMKNPEIRQKVSKKLKGKSAWNKGLKSGNYGNGFKKGMKGYWSSKKRPKLHSEEWKKILSERLKGEKSHFWKGGISPENHLIRNGLNYKLWHKSVLQRDNFTCQKYGLRGGKLHSHHINNFADFPELRFAIDNGITLSKKAHDEFHKKYGYKNNTKGQLEEFLT